MIIEETLDNTSQPATLFGHRLMPHPIELFAYLFHLPPKTLRYALPLHCETSILPAFSTNMRKTKKVKRFWLSFTSSYKVLLSSDNLLLLIRRFRNFR